jgi:hypothetical protein
MSNSSNESKERFTAEDGPGERGYRGRKGEDTPPGSVPGGSYGGGGGVQQGGFDRTGPEESGSRDAGTTQDTDTDEQGATGS